MPTIRQETRGAGRPRSQRVDRAILAATLASLAEEGWSRLSMEGVARRAGVGKAAIYRRWKSREQVLTAAVAGMVSEIRIPDRGSIEEDLLELMRQAVRLYRGDPGRIMPGLVAAMAEHESVARAVREGFLAPRRRALGQVLERAVARGEVPGDVDREIVLDFLGGPLFYRLLVTGGPIDDALARGTVDVMLRGLGRAKRTTDSGG